ncbi:MOSC domain-containing protein [Proteobacteria bacterium 005FR1]|nr:MOSC domain-containing protein [Proteobacteria bacterium 005FR1]
MEAALELIRQSPRQFGTVQLIVCRPANDQRRELQSAELSTAQGLHGDNWKTRQSKREIADTDMQITMMNSRAIAAIAANRADWSLAGDQLFVDFDLSPANLPVGTRLRVGSAIIEVTAEPHLGCRKFSERFGKDAVLFVNSAVGKSLNLRGINARVVTGGTVACGDAIVKC